MTDTANTTPVPATNVVATVTHDPVQDKFVCTVDGVAVGSSKHQDYFEYHYRRGDIARLAALNVNQFAYLNADGTVKEVHVAQHGAPKVKAAPAPVAAPVTDPAPAAVAAIVAVDAATAGVAEVEASAALPETDAAAAPPVTETAPAETATV